MAIPFPEAGKDELAVTGGNNLSRGMWRRIREAWEMGGLWVKVILPLGLLFLLVLGVGVIWVLDNRQGRLPEDSSATSAAPTVRRVSLEEAVPDSEALPNLNATQRALLEQHFVALGGVNRLASIRSLLSSGDIVYADGTKRSVVVIKKEGSRIRYSVRTPSGQQVMAVTPEDSWRCVWKGGQLVLLEDLPPEEADALRRSAYVVSELYLAMQNSWSIRYLGQQAFNYEMAHCFEVKVDARHSIRFFIDPETFLDAGREEWVFDQEGNLTITRVIGSEHMDIGGLKVPSKVEVFENNVYRQTFLATDAEVNPGILADAFDRPEAEVQETAKPLPAAGVPDR